MVFLRIIVGEVFNFADESGEKWRKRPQISKTFSYSMMSFIGKIECKLDSKGRVFIPAPFRKILQQRGVEGLVMKKDTDNPYLTIYPMDVWEAKLSDLKSRLNEWEAEDRMALIQYVADAMPLEMDSQGRVLLQKKWTDVIGVKEELLFVGGIDTITIWSKERFEEGMLNTDTFRKIISAKS